MDPCHDSLAVPRRSPTEDGSALPGLSSDWTRLGPISVLRIAGRLERPAQAERILPRGDPRGFHLLLNLASHMSLVNGSASKILRGEAVLLDAELAGRLELSYEYDLVHAALPEKFLRQWLPSSIALLGQRIHPGSGWGAVLCAILRQLTPDFLAHPPLPGPLIADQLGTLLALLAAEAGAAKSATPGVESNLRERIHDYVEQCCAESSLAAGNAARALGVSPRTLHRSLAAAGETFGGLLMTARTQLSIRMLTGPAFKHLTTAEIGRRVGFRDASHFTRVFKRYSGMTPSSFRRSATPGTKPANSPLL